MLGRPIRVWLQRFLLTHRQDDQGWQRLEWPDGEPLLAQPWPQVWVLHAIGDELERAAAERRRRSAGEVAARTRSALG